MSLLNDSSFIKPTSPFWHSLATTCLNMLSTVTSKKRLSRRVASVGLSFLLLLLLACSVFIIFSSRLNQFIPSTRLSTAEDFKENVVHGNLFASLSKEDLTGDLGLSSLQAKKVLLEMEIAHELTSNTGGGADPEEIKRLEEELQAKNIEIADLKAMLQSMKPTEHAPAPSVQEKRETKCALLFFGLFRDFRVLALPSIQRNVLAHNSHCDIYLHTYNVSSVHPEDAFLLTNNVSISTMDEFWDQRGAFVNHTRENYSIRWGDCCHTHDNMMKQWHSIAGVWSLMRQHEDLILSGLQNHSGAHYYQQIGLLRSDVYYATPVDVFAHPAAIADFAHWGGLNDRLFYGKREYAEVWADRFSFSSEFEATYMKSPDRYHSESYVAALMQSRNVPVTKNKKLCMWRLRPGLIVRVRDCSLGTDSAGGFTMQTSKEVFLRHIPEAVDLQMIDAKHAQVTLRNGTRTTQRPNVTAQASGPLLPFNNTGRVFVCITGQVQRLVPMRIKETILEPLRQQGYEVDIALIVSDGRSHSTNGREGLSMFETYQNASRFFSSNGFSVVTNSSITQPDHPIVPPNYLRLMDKVKMTESWQRARVQNHARQFETLTKCYDALLLTTERRYNANISFESSPTKYYDFSIRLREDVSLQEPLNVYELLPLLYPTNTSEETVLGTDCRIHGGMNDRMALVSREAMQNYYEGPWKFFSQADSDLNSTSFKHSVHNPESFLYYVYKTRLNMTVIRTPKLRGIIKYTFRNDGTQEHPNLVVVPAPLEDNEICPKN